MNYRMTVPSSALYNYLHERNAKLTLLEQTNILDSNLELEASSAFIELMLKVRQSDNEEAREFWESRLFTLEKLIDHLRYSKNEITRLEVEYGRLYRRSEDYVARAIEAESKLEGLRLNFVKSDI